MTVIRPNSISGITSITAQANEINVFRSNGLIAGLNLNGVNFNTTAGISTLAALKVTGNVDIAGVLTYQDVTNVDSLGIGTFRTGINVSGGQLDVGSNIKLGNAGVITATSFSGSGANLTSLPAQATIANNADNRIITGGSGVNLNGEANLTFDGNILTATQGNSAIGAIIKNTAHDSELQILATYANKNSKLLFGDAADDDVGIIDYDHNTNNMIFTVNASERIRIDSSGQFALGRTGQITANGNQSTSVFEQLSNNNYPLAIHSAQSNNRGLAIFYATTGAGNAGDPFIVCTDNTNNKFQVTSDGTITNRGNILPAVNNSKDLGSSSLRWANLYTQDLQLSNEAKKDTGGNSVDGTWGDWTLQEGESDVFMINNRSGKKYMFMLKEVV